MSINAKSMMALTSTIRGAASSSIARSHPMQNSNNSDLRYNTAHNSKIVENVESFIVGISKIGQNYRVGR